MAEPFHFDLTGIPLELCLQVASIGHSKILGWSTQTEPTDDKNYQAKKWSPSTPAGRLIFHWANHKESKSDIFPIGPSTMQAIDLESMIVNWLKEADYGPQPDIDGSCRKGWRVYIETWNRINGDWTAAFAVEPVWLEFHK